MIGEHHVGVLVPWANTIVERELPKTSGGKLIWHYARLMPRNRQTELDDSFLRGLHEAIPEARDQLSRLPLSKTYLACTSVDFRYPEMNTLQDTSMISAFSAIVDCLRVLHAQRIVLCTPYPDQLGRREEHELCSRGFDVIGACHLNIKEAFASVSEQQICGMVDRMPDALANADALVMSCTAWPTLDTLPKLERRLQKPILSSNLAIAISASRICSDII